MGGFDAGYIYEYSFEQAEPISCIQIPDAENIQVNSFTIMWVMSLNSSLFRLNPLFSRDHYMVFGMNDGTIRIYNRKKDFKDFTDYWKLYMHDNLKGNVNCIKFSYDKKNFFSIGADGNFFVYDWNAPVEVVKAPKPKPIVKVNFY